MKEANTATLRQAYEIAKEYNGNLTARQLYYRLVAAGFIANTKQSYQRIISILTDARLSGDFPFEWLMDRTREARPGEFTKNQVDVADALNNAANEVKNAPSQWLWSHRWWNQPKHVSVWVEKEALAGVFEKPCTDLGVAWFVLRGYSSISALSQWVDNVSEAVQAANNIEEVIVLYFGDHDPDGWEIPRSAERNIEAIASVRGIDLPPVRFERVALLKEQINLYKPPPFPAKETSSRYNSYVSEHGLTNAWELDALRPDVLTRLIQESVIEYFDNDIFDENRQVVLDAREEMKGKMNGKWVKSALSIKD